jgi:H+-transporting ATPase
MPEHKFQIVERIRAAGHVTGMTGDGVNDAPALKRADIGVAVHGATDAAKAAADIVLTEPGLSVIIDAIFRSRKIFQRMRNYCIYRISCTIQLLFFFFFAILFINPNSDYFYGGSGVAPSSDLVHPAAFTLPVISLVIITILNDGTMITIAHDKVIPEKRPQRWAMFEVTIISLVLGLVACLSSMLLLVIMLHANALYPGGFVGNALGSGGRDYILWSEAQTMIYLKISLSDFLTLFAARTRTWFWERRPGYALGVACLAATSTSTIMSLFWDDIVKTDDAQMSGLRRSKYACLSIWIYCILWFFVQDAAKVGGYWVLEYLTQGDTIRVKEQKARGEVAAMIDADRRQARLQGRGVGREISFATATDLQAFKGEVNAGLGAKVANLEKEVTELKALLKQTLSQRA